MQQIVSMVEINCVKNQMFNLSTHFRDQTETLNRSLFAAVRLKKKSKAEQKSKDQRSKGGLA
jgi:hypothetical protein